MIEEIISFKTSVLAKEKGFNRTAYYHTWFYDPEDKGLMYVSVVDYVTKYSKLSMPAILAPTQSLLQRWLREEHNIHFDIKYEGTTNTEKVPEYYVTSRKMSIGIFNTYEEALEVGLFEALKTIK